MYRLKIKQKGKRERFIRDADTGKIQEFNDLVSAQHCLDQLIESGAIQTGKILNPDGDIIQHRGKGYVII
ncbi:MAG: hypothetical protein V2I97_16015 [Desulfococcaceae bacterium]|nr:hypothetical protein [Desulfococcaceae bacterium]